MIAGISDRLRALLAEAASQGVAPRLDAAIWREGTVSLASSHAGAPGLFDLASLTKPLASGLLALSLCAEGTLPLDEPDRSGTTVRQLLDHTAGYAAWAPLFRACLADPEARGIFDDASAGALTARPFRAGRLALEAALERVLPSHPPGSQTIYSDLGMLKLQRRLEAAAGLRLNRAFEQRIAAPLGVELAFTDLEAPLRPAAEVTGTTRPRPPAPGQAQALEGVRSWRSGACAGEVDDDNAYALCGIAGHAGLFGTARAVALAGAAFLGELAGERRLAPPALARTFCEPSGPGGRGLGWDRASATGSSLGTLLGRGPRGAVGHLGFTGSSVWIDLDAQVVIALCSNRVALGRDNQLIRDFRPRFHDAVARLLGLA